MDQLDKPPSSAGYRTHIGLGEVADIAATHAVKSVETYGPLRCECGKAFEGFSEHAFHLATEAVEYANGKRLDPEAQFDRAYGKDDE